MLARTLARIYFRTASHHKEVHTAEIIAKMAALREQIKNEQKELNDVKNELKGKEEETNKKNRAIMDKRIKLTEDFKKTEQIWADAKKKSEANKVASIKEFAGGLVGLGKLFVETKKLQTEAHSVDLREGFDNTARLFFNTLEKFKIKKISLKVGDKVKKEEVEVVKQQKSDKPEQKGTIASIVEEGWELEGTVIAKPKVVLFN